MKEKKFHAFVYFGDRETAKEIRSLIEMNKCDLRGYISSDSELFIAKRATYLKLLAFKKLMKIRK